MDKQDFPTGLQATASILPTARRPVHKTAAQMYGGMFLTGLRASAVGCKAGLAQRWWKERLGIRKRTPGTSHVCLSDRMLMV